MPKDYNLPSKTIESLKEIWEGKEVDKVREKHFKNQSEEISICEKCTAELYRDNSIICPECKYTNTVPSITCFPRNLALINV